MTTTADRPSFTCPRCHMTSHHPDDARHGYCGACHAFTGRTRAPEPGTAELGTWKPEVITAVDALRGLDWTGFDPASLDDLADIAAVVVGALNPGPDVGDLLPPPTE